MKAPWGMKHEAQEEEPCTALPFFSGVHDHVRQQTLQGVDLRCLRRVSSRHVTTNVVFHDTPKGRTGVW